MVRLRRAELCRSGHRHHRQQRQDDDEGIHRPDPCGASSRARDAAKRKQRAGCGQSLLSDGRAQQTSRWSNLALAIPAKSRNSSTSPRRTLECSRTSEKRILEFFRDQENSRERNSLCSEGARAVCNALGRRFVVAHAGRRSGDRCAGDVDQTGRRSRHVGHHAGSRHSERRPSRRHVGASHAFAAWRLFGEHHLRDALAAAGAAILAGLSFEDALAQLRRLRLPPGRFELAPAPSEAHDRLRRIQCKSELDEHALRSFAELPANAAYRRAREHGGTRRTGGATSRGGWCGRRGRGADWHPLRRAAISPKRWQAARSDAGMPADSVIAFAEQ